MHGEDNQLGLNVHDGFGRTWTAFGDKFFRFPANSINRERVREAVKASAAEIYNAFMTASSVTIMSLYIPRIDVLPNNAPLFSVVGGDYSGGNLMIRSTNLKGTGTEAPSSTIRTSINEATVQKGSDGNNCYNFQTENNLGSVLICACYSFSTCSLISPPTYATSPAIPFTCDNTCSTKNNNVCDDDDIKCDLGTDCNDCGIRFGSDKCASSKNTNCDETGPSPSCVFGTDMTDCKKATYNLARPAPVKCGDGSVGLYETCDDGNRVSGDGCNKYCEVEYRWRCNGGSPSSCDPSSVLRPGLSVAGQVSKGTSEPYTFQQPGEIIQIRIILEDLGGDPDLYVNSTGNKKWSSAETGNEIITLSSSTDFGPSDRFTISAFGFGSTNQLIQKKNFEMNFKKK